MKNFRTRRCLAFLPVLLLMMVIAFIIFIWKDNLVATSTSNDTFLSPLLLEEGLPNNNNDQSVCEDLISTSANLLKVWHTRGNDTTLKSSIGEMLQSIRRLLNGYCKEEVPLVDNILSGIYPKLFLITATYERATQKADLTRLSILLRQVPNIVWIVIEDSSSKSQRLSAFLIRSNILHVHLNAPKPEVPAKKIPGVQPSRGIEPRNKGLEWLAGHLSTTKENGVIYFMDDDNTYTHRILEEMRFTKSVSVWPVGLTGGWYYNAPVVKNGRVVEWFDAWRQGLSRKFPLDMAGFAFHAHYLMDNPDLRIRPSKPGWLESDFIESLGVTTAQLEPLADNCTEILAWHTKTAPLTLPKGVKGEVDKQIKDLAKKGIQFKNTIKDVW